MRHIASIVAFAIVAIASSYGCSTQAPVPNCVPGQSAACVGNAGCAGSQVCTPGGTYAACECGTPVADGGGSLPDGATPDGAMPDGAIPDGAAPDGALPPQDAGTDAGPFSPDQLDLSLWLDAEKGIVPDVTYPSRIKRWFDQSGHGNNAEVGGCSGDPLVCMPRIDPKVIGGHDAVQQGFRSTYFTIANSPSMQLGTGDWAIVLVGKLLANGQQQADTLWSRGGLDLRLTSQGVLDMWVAQQSRATLAIPNPNTFQIIVTRGQKNEIRIGGSTATGTQTTANLDDCVGCPTTLLGRANMSVAELLAVKGGLTDLQVAQVTAYYKAKYNLP